MTSTLVATLDGRLRAADSPLIHADDFGLLRGDGIFETTFAVDGVPRDIDEHLARFAVSAGLLGLELPDVRDWRRGHRRRAGRLDRRVARWCSGWSAPAAGKAAAVPTAFVLGGPPSEHLAHERRDGDPGAAAAAWFRRHRDRPDAVVVARRQDAVLRDQHVGQAVRRGERCRRRHLRRHRRQILEGPTATVVLARTDRTPKTLVTTPTDGILAGVTVRRLFRDAAAAGWQTSVEPLRPADLTAADGCWLVSGVRLLAPVVAIDGRHAPARHRARRVGRAAAGALTDLGSSCDKALTAPSRARWS